MAIDGHIYRNVDGVENGDRDMIKKRGAERGSAD
jgi:hypothetical protein